MQLTDSIVQLKGIGDKTAVPFMKLGVNTINDLLHFFPKNYSTLPDPTHISDIHGNEYCVVKARILNDSTIFSMRGKTILRFDISDGTGIIQVNIFGMPYLKKVMVRGREAYFHGLVKVNGMRLLMANPKLYEEEQYQECHNNLQPTYALTKGLTLNAVQKAMKEALNLLPQVQEHLSEECKERYQLLDLQTALQKMHFPTRMEEVYEARKRLAFDEFYLFLLKMQLLKNKTEKYKSPYVIDDFSFVNSFLLGLPYQLTNGQKLAWADIMFDLKSGFQMNRLIQGDVGCGKTILAFSAALAVIQRNYQAALMAPTEVLARQHFQDIAKMNEQYHLNLHPILLSGSMTAKEKRDAKEIITSGEADFIIGTHAVIQKDVTFKNLGIVICDEQHRFGVKQRSDFSEKGNLPHILVMSATPIPRTLGIILYGDLDISVIKELPAERKPIKNTVVGQDYRPKIYQFMMKHIKEGRQVYVICPMVEESEELDAENVSDYKTDLEEVFPSDVRIGMLHGKMKPKEKDEIMTSFKNHDLDILVSTTVIEVGVNVPNATIMLIENAERFGLSQLHQLRGRVGRGSEQSYCIFMYGNDGKKTQERLAIMGKTNDGFEIASEDLKQRGPGDFFGLRQSGMPGFQIADIYTDAEVLKSAKEFLEEQLSKKDSPELLKILRELEFNTEFSYLDFHQICL